MNPIPAGPKFKCQVCFVSFSSNDLLELHIDAYTQLITFLMERVSKAASHHVPLRLDPLETDENPIDDFPSKCPLPQCTTALPVSQLKWHFAEHMHCFESCPGCGYTFVNACIFLKHVKTCVRITQDETKVEHSMRMQRAIVQRTRTQFKKVMKEFGPKPTEQGQGGNGESLPQNPPPQNPPPQNPPPQNPPPQNPPPQNPPPQNRPQRNRPQRNRRPQNRTPQNPPPQNPPPQDFPPQSVDPQDLFFHNFASQNKGPGLIYAATDDATALDQAIGLTEPDTTNQAQQQQALVQPGFLYPHAFGPTPEHTPGHTPGPARRNTMPPPSLPPPRHNDVPQVPPDLMSVFMGSDFFMDTDIFDPFQHNPN